MPHEGMSALAGKTTGFNQNRAFMETSPVQGLQEQFDKRDGCTEESGSRDQRIPSALGHQLLLLGL